MTLSKELLAQINRIQVKAGRLATETLSGEYKSAFRGSGMEFDEVREYQPGDDVRAIDWNVTARMRQPFIKIFREERERTIMIMVDVSPSQVFGTRRRFKVHCATELAAVLAYLAIRNQDKVGLIVFSDYVEHFIPPKKGRAHVWHIIREVLVTEGKGRKTDVGGALDFLMRVQKRRSLCFLISDFYSLPFERQLGLACRRHEVVCARLADPMEEQLPHCGVVSLIDSESGVKRTLDTSDPSVRQEFARRKEERERTFQDSCRRMGASTFVLRNDQDVTDALIPFLKRREQQKTR